MSTDGKTNEVIVELCKTVRKGNSLFVQINQDHFIEGDETQAIDSRITFKVFSEFFECMWQCLFYEIYVSVKPKISTLSVACLQRFSEACG